MAVGNQRTKNLDLSLRDINPHDNRTETVHTQMSGRQLKAHCLGIRLMLPGPILPRRFTRIYLRRSSIEDPVISVPRAKWALKKSVSQHFVIYP